MYPPTYSLIITLFLYHDCSNSFLHWIVSMYNKSKRCPSYVKKCPSYTPCLLFSTQIIGQISHINVEDTHCHLKTKLKCPLAFSLVVLLHMFIKPYIWTFLSFWQMLQSIKNITVTNYISKNLFAYFNIISKIRFYVMFSDIPSCQYKECLIRGGRYMYCLPFTSTWGHPLFFFGGGGGSM